ncbi:MAG: hypothetical protein GF308_12805 [Candidatus Heimdallarchaeota archaeon]|nr:hypothetical protein [Candidatus Heimdallarchaeota archaeon]
MYNKKELEMLVDIRKKYDQIRAILEERVLLFTKRKKETKRAIKASSRAGIILDPYRVFITLAAEVNYATNLIGLRTIDLLLSEIDEILEKKNKITTELAQIYKREGTTFSSYEKIRSVFQDQMQKSTTIIAGVSIDNKTITSLTRIAFSLNENIRRELVAKFIFNHLSILLSKLFKELLILDQSCLAKTTETTQQYLMNHFNVE